jgi:hypothetical protein
MFNNDIHKGLEEGIITNSLHHVELSQLSYPLYFYLIPHTFLALLVVVSTASSLILFLTELLQLLTDKFEYHITNSRQM